MSIHYLPGYHPTTTNDASLTRADASRLSASKADKMRTESSAVSNALTVTQRSPGWNNRKPDIQRVQLGACTLLAVPYRRWAWRRHEQLVAQRHRMEA
jgi:hypothetical protein